MSEDRINCEECGWPQDACCCEFPTHPDNPTGTRRCAECGGDHEPSGARTDCILHWKRRAMAAESVSVEMASLCRAIEPWASHHACNARSVNPLAHAVYNACCDIRRIIYPAKPR